MKVYLWILIVLCVLAGCKPSKPGGSRIEQSGDVYVLSFADISFGVSAAKGGRIISFKHKEKEVLIQDSVHSKYYGATLWLSPQSAYWPQHPGVDELPYSAEIDDRILRLVSSSDSISGVCITKEFSISEEDSSVWINYYVRNVSGQPKRLAPWDVARVHRGLSFYPVGEEDQQNLSDVKGMYKKDGMIWISTTDSVGEKAQKLFSTARDGWMAHYNEGLLFVKRFPDVTPDDVPPGQGEVEIFIAPEGQYLELENHGRYTELQPGESLTYKQNWFLKIVPDSTALPYILHF